MSKFLYITGDAVGMPTGGGVVTANEGAALHSFSRWSDRSSSRSDALQWSFPESPRPWGPDEAAVFNLTNDFAAARPRLAHFYSGTFSRTVALLKERGCIVTYTVAAHDVKVSREEHEKFDLGFSYPHLTDEAQWKEYIRGYLLADVVVCPSEYSAEIMRGYGCQNVVVIPHGVYLPAVVQPWPRRFSVAYLGQPGPDKGLIYLLQAWKMLNWREATLTIAGRGTEALLDLVRQQGGGNIYLRGAVDDVSDVYNACLVYVQPSATEAFGIEVLEARAHGRLVICSDGAGARDFADVVVPKRNAGALATAIANAESYGNVMRRTDVTIPTWDSVRDEYCALWTKLLG